jgi:hypothetical protein
MAWFIKSGVNEGYPALNGWADEWQTGWTSNDNVRYPDSAWRIDGSTNEGYPWIWYWFKTTQTDTGNMMIGGSQTNYPNGLATANRGGIANDFDNQNMISTGNLGGIFANSVITRAIDGRAWCISGAELTAILSSLNDPDIFDTAAIELISKMYGANIFDCFLGCKVFPFDIGNLEFKKSYEGQSYTVISGDTGTVKAFGRYDLASDVHKLASTVGYYHFPTLTVYPQQAWEIESIDYSLYLPMAGTFPIDIRGESDIDIMLYVDMIDGTGEYYVHINRQLIGIYRVMFAADVPLNTNQGRMQANMLTNVIATAGKAAGAIIGGVVGGVGGAMAGANIGENVAGSTLGNQHYAMSTPAIGGLASMQCMGYPRVMAKIPKMFKDGYGFEQVLGANRSTAYMRLSECSGFTKTVNYKCDIIVATDGEKTEIEQLLNEGVMI